MIFAIVGPSGAGKDTLIEGVIRARADLRLARRIITRPTEAGGERFEGVTEAEFGLRRSRGDFALDWQAHGLRYAIPWQQISGPGHVIFNGSRIALPAALTAFPDLRVILVTAPAAVLAERLVRRGRETAEDVHARLSRAAFALPAGIAAVTVENAGSPEAGIKALLDALQPERA